MSRRIAILAALPAELKPLVKGWQQQRAPRFVSLWTKVDADGDVLIAACAGMGAHAARSAFRAAEADGPLDLVLSVGLAGATREGLHVGAVNTVSEIVDAQTGERFTLSKDKARMRLATAAQAANTAEKARLLATYGAALVDMEAATVARLASMRSLPMGCIKAVSDESETVLPEIDRFVSAEGQLSVPKFLLHLAVRPQSWGAVARLASNSRKASLALAQALRDFLTHKDWEFINRTGRFSQPVSSREIDSA